MVDEYSAGMTSGLATDLHLIEHTEQLHGLLVWSALIPESTIRANDNPTLARHGRSSRPAPSQADQAERRRR